jgi:cell division inhibitor SepF
MGGALRKTMVYLGLAEDDERYDAYDVDDDLVEDRFDDKVDDFRGDRLPERHVERHDVEPEPEHRAPVTPIGRGHVARVMPAAAAATELHRISTIHPRTYNEAKTIGEAFRAGTPVIMNLSDLDDADAKRLIDFAAGLIFGLHGAIERITAKVFLLSPANVEVSPAEKVRVPERTFFNQS